MSSRECTGLAASLISVVRLGSHRRDANLNDRYLDHLFQIHITHLDRLKGFLDRRSTTGVGVIGDGVAAFKRTMLYVDFLLHEARAGRAFAAGLSCVSRKQLFTRVESHLR